MVLKMHQTVCAIVILITTLVSNVFSQPPTICSNFKFTHPQDMFCSRDFALVGVITDRGPDTLVNLIPVTARVIRKIKGNNVGAVDSHFVYRTHPSKSGFRPKVGTMTYLPGDVVNGVNRIDWCLTNFPKTLATWTYILTAGRYSYRRNCACKIIEDKSRAANSLSCTIPNGKEKCYYDNAICRRVTKNSCAWRNNEQC